MTEHGTTKTTPAGGSLLGFAALLAVAVVLFVVCATIVMPFMPDDSYVTYRYAEQFAEGNGLAYNTGGERVEGYSNFLWVMIAAAVHSRGADLPATMPWVGVITVSYTHLTLPTN